MLCSQLIEPSAVVYTTSQICLLNFTVHGNDFVFICSDEDLSNTTLNVTSFGVTSDVWINTSFNCTGNEVCLTKCLTSIPTSLVDRCSNDVGVTCSKDE